jgi:hypothetical protein
MYSKRVTLSHVYGSDSPHRCTYSERVTPLLWIVIFISKMYSIVRRVTLSDEDGQNYPIDD